MRRSESTVHSVGPTGLWMSQVYASNLDSFFLHSLSFLCTPLPPERPPPPLRLRKLKFLWLLKPQRQLVWQCQPVQHCRGENYFHLSLLWYPSLPALLNSFPLFPPPFPSTHLALTYNCCEPHRKHDGRLAVCVCVCYCVSLGAFDPIKTSNLDGRKSLHTFSSPFLCLSSVPYLHLALLCCWETCRRVLRCGPSQG